MAIRTVANASQLNSAIKAAGSGDTIQLKAGNYGTVQIANSNKVLTITSESGWNGATFREIKVVKSSNITFDDLDFAGATRGGFGTGTGLKIHDSRNIKIEDSEFQDYYKALTVNGSQGISVIRNDFTRNAEDAMAFGNVNGLQVIGNEVKGMKAPNDAHHDMIQITPAGGASSNVVIRGNVLDSNDLSTQAIYIGNGGVHRNITIEDNKIISGHHHGITVGKTAGLKINDNIVMKDPSINSTKDLHTPKINVAGGSSNVQITGNTTYDINSPSGVGYNKIVSESVKFGGSQAPSGGGTASSWTPSEPSTASEPWTPPAPSTPNVGSDDTFRFDGNDVRNWTKASAPNVELERGDELHFSNYDRGTFDDIGGGNPLSTSWDGRAATVDSRADLKELIAASPDVKAVKWGETLALRIKQDDGTHAVVLNNIGDADYFL